MWTKEDQQQRFDDLLQRKTSWESAARTATSMVEEMLTNETGDVSFECMLLHAGKIRDLLKPFDDGAREWPAPPSAAHVVDVTTLHDAEPRFVKDEAPKWLRGEEAPNHFAAGCARNTGRLKRMGPETGNMGYWFVDPEAYSIGPFQTLREREIYIKRMFLEPPPVPCEPFCATERYQK